MAIDKNSETYKNLQKAFSGEAKAHLKYQYYQKKLTNLNEKYQTVLDEIIHNEKEHGKIWFKVLHDGEIPENEANLIDAIAGETYEATEMYISMAETAKKEEYIALADLFYKVASIEQHHANRFKEIKKELTGDLFDSNEACTWKCLNCGYILTGFNAPYKCPVCEHLKKYFTKED